MFPVGGEKQGIPRQKAVLLSIRVGYTPSPLGSTSHSSSS